MIGALNTIKRWRAHRMKAAWGDQPCSHLTFAGVLDRNDLSRDAACETCGQVFTFDQVQQYIAANLHLYNYPQVSPYPPSAADDVEVVSMELFTRVGEGVDEGPEAA